MQSITNNGYRSSYLLNPPINSFRLHLIKDCRVASKKVEQTVCMVSEMMMTMIGED